MNITKQRIAVYGLILNEDKKFVIIKRAPHDSFPNLWELPGGAVDLGENPKKAIVREVFEETQLNIKVLYPISLLNGQSVKDPTIQVIRIVYFCRQITKGPPVLSPDHSEYRWITFTKLPPVEYTDIFTETLKIINNYPHLITNR